MTMMMALVVFAAFLFGAALAEDNTKCTHPFYSPNPFPTVLEELRITCFNEGGCGVLFSPPGCGCGSECVSPLNNGETTLSIPYGETVLGMTVEVGSGVCCSEQCGVYESSDESREWPRASMSGTKFSYGFSRLKVKTCAISALQKVATVNYRLYIGSTSTEKKTVTVPPFNTTHVEVIGSPTAVSLLSLLADNNVTITCWGYRATTYEEWALILPVTVSPLFGWPSTFAVWTHVNCDDLSPFTNTDVVRLCAGSDGTFCSFDTVVQNYTILTGAPQYAGSAIVATAFGTAFRQVCMAMTSTADGDGNEASTFISQRHFTKRFIFPQRPTTVSILAFDFTGDPKCEYSHPSGIGANFSTPPFLGPDEVLRVSYANEDSLPDGIQGRVLECEAEVAVATNLNGFEQTLIGEESSENWEKFVNAQCG